MIEIMPDEITNGSFLRAYRFDGYCYGSSIEATVSIAGYVIKRVGADKAPIRRVGHINAVNDNGSIGRLGHRIDCQRIAIHVDVVCKNVDYNRHTFVGRRSIIVCHRIIVDWIDRNRHRGDVGIHGAVSCTICKGIGSVEVRVRHVLK